ncbi:MAG TPA: tRNA (adenosine(37)-N6)-dimethylallyltransferase MiaA [Polyangia bacterium]|jgi:tRNA dimethylallyltransferase
MLRAQDLTGLAEEAQARPRVIAVVGPTASGKTDLAIAVAEALGGEIISVDSMQVYRGLDIGTAKPDAAARARVPHHLLDVAEPGEEFSAARFALVADAAAAAIAARGRAVIACGGTGLYLRAWLDGLFEAPAADPAIRARHRELGPAEVAARLAAVDPAAAAAIQPNDLVRLSRALEVYEQTGVPITELRRRAARGRRYRARIVGVDPPRAELYRRIDGRFAAMMAAGLVDEVRRVIDRYGPQVRPLGALGYRQIRAHLLGELESAEAVRLAQRDTRHFARRQLTWFRAEPGVAWHPDAAAVDVAALARFLANEGDG